MSLILHADHLITMNRENEVIPNGAVLIDPDGRIRAVGEVHSIINANPGVEVKRLEDRLLMPGLVNTHAHSGLLRGTAEGLQCALQTQRAIVEGQRRYLTAQILKRILRTGGAIHKL